MAGGHKYNREYEQKGGKTAPERLQGDCHSNNYCDAIFCSDCFLNCKMLSVQPPECFHRYILLNCLYKKR